LLHSHLFLHDQLTFADISGTDTFRSSAFRGITPVMFSRDQLKRAASLTEEEK
jgi:hypothetical protein